MKKIFKAVIWDFGGVFTSSPFDAFARYEAEQGLPQNFIRTVNATNPLDNAWAKLEQSKVDAAEFDGLFRAESKALGHEVPGADVLKLLSGSLRPRVVEALTVSKLGIRKPDPRIYALMCEALEVDPSDCVYLDDLGINLKPARAMGMTTIKVLGEDQLLDDLKSATGYAVV